jgi:hypothetical protein
VKNEHKQVEAIINYIDAEIEYELASIEEDEEGYHGASIDVSGTGCIVQNNIGFVTENSGTQTLGAAETSMDVPHGLAVTPTDGDIMVIAVGDMLNTNKIRVGNYGATNFTLYADVAPGGAGTLYAFKAIVM